MEIQRSKFTQERNFMNLLKGKKFTKFLIPFIILLMTLSYYIGLKDSERVAISDKREAIIKIERDKADKIAAQEKIISVWIKKINRAVPIEMVNIISHDVCKQASDANLPIPLIVAIMQRESHFNPLAVSKSKASGLMQVLNGGKGINIDKDKVFDISYNIAKGIEIFREHLRLKKGSLDDALFGYVGGDRSYANDIYKIIGEFSLFEAVYKGEN